MTEMEYNQAEGIRRSDLWKMEDSPEKFKYFLEHPIEQTQAMAFGSACHKYILEGKSEFNKEYVVAPIVDRRTKAGKEIGEQLIATNPDKTVVSVDDYSKMVDMLIALEQCDLARSILHAKGQTEAPFFWTDKVTGEKCKIKCDKVVTIKRKKYVIDYKTTKSADTNRFNSEIFKLGYYMQAGMYAEGVMKAKKLKKLPGFIFVAQEKDPPYAVNVIEVTPDVMAAGINKFHDLLQQYHECKAVDMWPGYVGETPNVTSIPGWIAMQEEE